jgi:hypothetical protein
MYNNLASDAARTFSDEVRRSVADPGRRMAAELRQARRSRRRRWRTQ